jgi:hypothetical protein
VSTIFLPANFPTIMYHFNPLITSLLCFYIKTPGGWWTWVWM